MIRPIRTYSDPWLARHRDTHVKHASFGTHKHPYLHEMLGRLAAGLAAGLAEGRDERPSLLDYGCGKGVFMREMTQLNVFGFIRGYDPAIPAFKARPAQQYDLVICLDVLDQLEDDFVEPAIKDVAQFTRRLAVFDIITKQVPALEHLNPRSATTWTELIGNHMAVQETIIRTATEEERAAGACPERVIIVSAPRTSGG